VQAWIKTGSPQPRETRVLAHLDDFQPVEEVRRSPYGGWLEGGKVDATGFFHTKKIDNRWWLIDPAGYRFLHVALNSVAPQRGPQFQAAFPGRFGDKEGWARKTTALLAELALNGTGSWSDNELLRRGSPRPVYTAKWSFMGAFGKKLRVVHQEPGHLGYADGLIPVFHPEFETFCQEYARQLTAMGDDPYLLGHFSDNELQLPGSSLDRHLQLDPQSRGRKAAETWLRRRQGGTLDSRTVTDEDRDAWIAYVMNRYYSVVGAAIRKHDPNHLYLGSRLYGSDRRRRALWQAAGRHLDAIAVNVYGTWTPTDDVRRWVQWSGKPVMATEWYAKGQDSGMENLTGAGWTVATQKERGYFYQNFVLGLIESRGCVGWHYFKYADNDPQDTRADPSNRNSNKGIVNARYELYTPLTDAMRSLNRQVYPLTQYFDR